MDKYHTINNIRFEESLLFITIDNNDYKIDLNIYSKKLANSSGNIKNNYIISPAGYGIHWPDIDEDLSIDGLIGVKTIKSDKSVSTKI